MAKPDLVDLYVTASGQLYKDDGESSLTPAFKIIPGASNDATASGVGVPIGGIYHNSGALQVRLT